MELLDVKYKIRCEMGACGAFAEKTIKMNRVGIRSQVHICKDCMKELHGILSSEIVPKSYETMKSKDKR